MPDERTTQPPSQRRGHSLRPDRISIAAAGWELASWEVAAVRATWWPIGIGVLVMLSLAMAVARRPPDLDHRRRPDPDAGDRALAAGAHHAIPVVPWTTGCPMPSASRVMKLLLVDDDAELVAVLALALERSGFAVWSADRTDAALALVDAEWPDLVVLDTALRAGDPLALLRALRGRSGAAVIMLTGRGDEDARVAGLEAGADDYVAKPFSPRELVARVRALLQHHDAPAPVAPALLTVGPLTLDVAARAVRHAGAPLALTALEFRLLHYLMRHAGTVVTFATLIRQVWGYDDPSATDVVRSTVYRLRRKLGDDPTRPHLLQSVPAVGFLLGDRPAPPPRTDA